MLRGVRGAPCFRLPPVSALQLSRLPDGFCGSIQLTAHEFVLKFGMVSTLLAACVLQICEAFFPIADASKEPFQRLCVVCFHVFLVSRSLGEIR